MIKKILNENIYYYEDAIDNFDKFMNTVSELEQLHAQNNSNFWTNWTSSNDKEHIYGDTKSFDLTEINKLQEPYKGKMLFIYDSIVDAMFRVSKDYADSIGDKDEPRLFPSYNIKKYYTGSSMGAHFDQLDGDETLRYSLVMYLNDDYEGGEISFKLNDYIDVNKVNVEHDYDIAIANNNIDFSVKPKANSIIIFPSSAPYYHTAHLVKSGFKYMVPGHWIHNNMSLRQNGM